MVKYRDLARTPMLFPPSWYDGDPEADRHEYLRERDEIRAGLRSPELDDDDYREDDHDR